MTAIRLLRATLVPLSCLTWLFPAGSLVAAPQSPKKPSTVQIHDLRLDNNGGLGGQVVNASAAPIQDSKLELRQNGKVLATTASDRTGTFSFANVRPGVYQVVVNQGGVACRVWSHDAAPPAAKEKLLIVSDPAVMRGQQPARALLTNPLFVGVVVAAAIAIPLAVHNANDDQSGS